MQYLEQKNACTLLCRILIKIMDRGSIFRFSQPWLLGIFESQKQCLLNICVRSKSSYLECSALLLEIRVTWWLALLFVSNHFTWDYLLYPPVKRLFTATPVWSSSKTCKTVSLDHKLDVSILHISGSKFKNRRRDESFFFSNVSSGEPRLSIPSFPERV